MTLFYDRCIRQLREFLEGSDHISADAHWLAKALTGDLGTEEQALAAEIVIAIDRQRKKLH